MKNLKYFVVAVVTILSVSCSSDDDNSGSSNENNITVETLVYEMKTAIVEPTLNNSVFLSLTSSTEAEIEASLNGTTLNNVGYFTARISYSDLTLGETYDLDAISSLEFIVDGDVINSEFENGISQFYKSGSNPDLEVVAGNITITNYTEDFIGLTLNFTRNDGVEISGTYEGHFINLSNGLD
ncbi:hypothetical protein KO494_12795 [Lacinutrix sp. C3R15]|uniref:hypothetical protein n=1 Tax=Flavobacteriaceae TaxID=49546 RepID=UPI001C09CBFB|nr:MULTISPECIES: hypothetical protein [Flavobacteriaceae]MBU2940417.1 hypothetical protein [Lacinutrix sp. C3R15]MDO6623737.1 hypothetical protein [Oceanihabitans sp. 1_MG-2023]